MYNPNLSGTEPEMPWVDTALQGLKTPTSLADSWLTGGSATIVSHRDNVRVPSDLGMKGSHPRMINRSHPLQLQQPVDENGNTLGSIPSRNVWKLQRHWCICDGQVRSASARQELPRGTTASSRPHSEMIRSHPLIIIIPNDPQV